MLRFVIINSVLFNLFFLCVCLGFVGVFIYPREVRPDRATGEPYFVNIKT